MKTFFTVVATVSLSIVIFVSVAGYVSRSNRLQTEQVALQQEVQTATSTETQQATTTKPVEQVPENPPATPEKPVTPPQKPKLTSLEVAKHASVSDCWIIIEDRVYSVASYIPMHPGGKTPITNYCGQDATTGFRTRGGTGVHSSKAFSILGSMIIGPLVTE